MPTSHPLMPEASHDEQAEQLFVLALKGYLTEHIDPVERRLAQALDDTPDAPLEERVKRVRTKMLGYDSYLNWISLRRAAQEFMWDVVRESVERQAGDLERLAEIENPKGSVSVDPDFEAPAYLRAGDVHLMPGGYHASLSDDSILQGALMDRGGAVYMLTRNNGLMNDGRGQTAMAHVLECYPDLEPRRILEVGCGVGASTVPAAQCFPEAEVHGIDVGASVLRYAHARAERLGAGIHFSQQSAEQTRFEDESFDLVYSCALIHETSKSAVPKIMAECHRLLRPGGVVVHLEVPLRYEQLDVWGGLICDFESRYNNEPFWTGALKADLAGELTRCGFRDVVEGFQPMTDDARHGPRGFSPENRGVFSSWYVASGRK